jgi:hypothetical protein
MPCRRRRSLCIHLRRISGSTLGERSLTRHCHRIDQSLPLEQINRVSNLAWLCWTCDNVVHGKSEIESNDSKIIKKVNRYRSKLH